MQVEKMEEIVSRSIDAFAWPSPLDFIGWNELPNFNWLGLLQVCITDLSAYFYPGSGELSDAYPVLSVWHQPLEQKLL